MRLAGSEKTRPARLHEYKLAAGGLTNELTYA